ncbi:MAG TPA: hypothetical protein DCG58_01760, partial [Hyphomonas adhaerens]|nr:hypothetical protein [Hyphomonas adhaerens]
MKIPAVKELLRLLARMAATSPVPQLLCPLEFGGDLFGERFSFRTPRPVFSGRRGAFNVVGIVMGRIDQGSGAACIPQRIEQAGEILDTGRNHMRNDAFPL